MSTQQPQDPRNGPPQQQYPPQYPPGQFAPYPPYQPQPTSGKAVASMVTGIASLVIPFIGIVTGPLAIVLGTRARSEIQRTGQKGDGLAIAGLVTGIIGCVGYAIFLVLLIIGATTGS
ncbi:MULTISPECIES: DUF4190 domain-containing protein [Streptomyces]|uniref:DUF4190 domain-containing protein n=1 Tax=Streptomyces siderophoricus TaxID=2802281 RepID=A0ABS1MXW8_9ACTN|nr:DUF4190 domain-containing protein [Streptomyces sp. 9-7]MBL1092622.1 DUF4190 domain-containing protein [Streptomyces sp. 9-7]